MGSFHDTGCLVPQPFVAGGNRSYIYFLGHNQRPTVLEAMQLSSQAVEILVSWSTWACYPSRTFPNSQRQLRMCYQRSTSSISAYKKRWPPAPDHMFYSCPKGQNKIKGGEWKSDEADNTGSWAWWPPQYIHIYIYIYIYIYVCILLRQWKTCVVTSLGPYVSTCSELGS
jgi:hypothetical protein